MTTEFLLGLSSLIAVSSADAGVIREWGPAGPNLLKLFLVVFFVLLNGFFVAAEFAIVKVRGSQLDALIAEGNLNAVRAKDITRKLDAYLSATQLGITIASLALGALAEPFAEALLQPLLVKIGIESEVAIHGISFATALFVVTSLHVILGELMPKSLAIRKPVLTTLFVARPMMLFHMIFMPAIVLFNGTANRMLKWLFRIDPVSESEMFHSADELRILLNETEQSEEVTSIERQILINALELNDLLARDIMTPRNEVVSLDVNEDFETNFNRALESQHTRFPLVIGHLDDFLGLVHVKDLLRLPREGHMDLRSIKRSLEVIPEMMPLDKLLKVFLEKRAHMALVVDEYGGSLGIVTLDNVLEELVGDIQDEFDTGEDDEGQFVRVSDQEFIVDGTLGLYELEEHVGLGLEDPEVTTVGGFVTHLLGHLPEVGENVEVAGYLVTVTETDGRTIGKLQFRRVVPLEPDEQTRAA